MVALLLQVVVCMCVCVILRGLFWLLCYHRLSCVCEEEIAATTKKEGRK